MDNTGEKTQFTVVVASPETAVSFSETDGYHVILKGLRW